MENDTFKYVDMDTKSDDSKDEQDSEEPIQKIPKSLFNKIITGAPIAEIRAEMMKLKIDEPEEELPAKSNPMCGKTGLNPRNLNKAKRGKQSVVPENIKTPEADAASSAEPCTLAELFKPKKSESNPQKHDELKVLDKQQGGEGDFVDEAELSYMKNFPPLPKK